MEREIISILTISVSNEYVHNGATLHLLLVSVFVFVCVYVTRASNSHLIKSLFRQSILIIFPLCLTECHESSFSQPLRSAVAVTRCRLHNHFYVEYKEQKAFGLRNINDENRCFVKKMSFFESFDVWAVSAPIHKHTVLANGTFIIEPSGSVRNHYHQVRCKWFWLLSHSFRAHSFNDTVLCVC